MTRPFAIAAIVMLCTAAHAEEHTFRFPDHLCSITLPESSEWRILPHELINDPETILVALASDGKVSANLSVVELKLESENEAQEVIDLQVAGMNTAGLEVTNIQKRDFARVPGWRIASKGLVNKIETVQTTWSIFANDRVYIVTGSMIGEDLTESEANRAAAVLNGIEINIKTKTDNPNKLIGKNSNKVHYLQSSGIFGGLAILTGVFVAIASTLVLLIGRSRRAHKISVIAAGIPIVIGATGTLIGYFTTRDLMLNTSPMQDSSVIHAWQSDVASCAIVGAATSLPLFIFLGVLFVYRSKHLQERPGL